MPQITLDPATLDVLRQLETAHELVDANGKLVGRFLPAKLPTEPKITEAEARRRAREEHGRGRKLADILADLEKLG